MQMLGARAVVCVCGFSFVFSPQLRRVTLVGLAGCCVRRIMGAPRCLLAGVVEWFPFRLP